jgi:DNA-binding PadR family transcriptional regulator
MDPLFEEIFSERRFYIPTFFASQISPNPVSAALLVKRTPYQNPEAVEKTLVDSVEAGYLKTENNGSYVVSQKGAQAIEDVHLAFYSHIVEINQFPAKKMRALADLLGKLVQACIQANLDNGTICLDISHNGHPGVEAHSLAKVDQYLDDLNAFRDDAHIAAWKPVGVSGQIWEALSFVWLGEKNTAAKLAEHLPFRGYTEEDYAQALNDLEKRGWIELSEDHYIINPDGKKLRDEAESTTNQIYFNPWKVLSEVELAELSELLIGLKTSNTEILESITNE